MRLKINVTFADGRSETVNVTPAVEVAVERKFEVTLAESQRREHVFFAAWTGLRHAGKGFLEFEEFLGTLASADLATDDPESSPDPTQPE